MTVLSGYGVSARLPSGFEGRIFRRANVGAAVSRTVAHFSTFPLPARVADFGSGAVTLMGSNDIFAVLFEYGPSSIGTALFDRIGMPRSLDTEDFRPYTIRRALGGQSGTQWFFVEQRRPFTLYAVLGSHARRATLVPRLNTLLAGVTIADGAVLARPA